MAELASDKLGLCIVKKCISNPLVIKELMENALVLMQDPYGNYAI